MQIDLDDKEARVLLNALRMYRAHIQDQAEARAAFAAEKAKRKHFYTIFGCCLSFPEKKEEIPYYKDDNFCAGLRDKLKQYQMKFPLEEHDIYRQYGYDKKIGYENPKWTKTTVGSSGGMMQREPDVEP